MRRVLSLKANYLARPEVKPGPHSRGRNSDLLYFAVCCTPHFSLLSLFFFFSPPSSPILSFRATGKIREPVPDIIAVEEPRKAEPQF